MNLADCQLIDLLSYLTPRYKMHITKKLSWLISIFIIHRHQQQHIHNETLILHLPFLCNKKNMQYNFINKETILRTA